MVLLSAWYKLIGVDCATSGGRAPVRFRGIDTVALDSDYTYSKLLCIIIPLTRIVVRIARRACWSRRRPYGRFRIEPHCIHISAR